MSDNIIYNQPSYVYTRHVYPSLGIDTISTLMMSGGFCHYSLHLLVGISVGDLVHSDISHGLHCPLVIVFLIASILL